MYKMHGEVLQTQHFELGSSSGMSQARKNETTKIVQ